MSLGRGLGERPPNSHHTIYQGCPMVGSRMCAGGHCREEAQLTAASSLGSWWCNRSRAEPHEYTAV